jgi:hypothetical protein
MPEKCDVGLAYHGDAWQRGHTADRRGDQGIRATGVPATALSIDYGFGKAFTWPWISIL